MKTQYSHKKALSIIEIMVGIFIFTLGISAIYMIISSTSRINTYNKNQIIASNLAREQIELIRNIRDTNYAKLQKWNVLKPYAPESNPTESTKKYSTVFTGATDFYKLELDFSSSDGKIKALTGTTVSDFKASLKDNSDTSEEGYRLCLDTQNRYIYCPNPLGGLKETPFYRYLEIQQLETKLTGGTVVNDAFKVRSKVWWNQKGIHSTEIPTILTDWKRL